MKLPLKTERFIFYIYGFEILIATAMAMNLREHAFFLETPFCSPSWIMGQGGT